MVRLEPLGAELNVAGGETLMDAACRAGYSWPTVCGGNAQCTVCFVTILAELDQVVPPSEGERAALRRYRGVDTTAHPEIRLACQLRFRGPATVRKAGVRPPNRGAP